VNNVLECNFKDVAKDLTSNFKRLEAKAGEDLKEVATSVVEDLKSTPTGRGRRVLRKASITKVGSKEVEITYETPTVGPVMTRRKLVELLEQATTRAMLK
jgi:hypothetical protein